MNAGALSRGEGPRDRIVVADDDAQICDLLYHRLSMEGFDVRVAGDGEEALRMILEFEPHAVVLDVMMPRVDGFEVCRRLRSQTRTRQLCVVLLTARADSGAKLTGLRAGADEYITKPFDPDEVVERIKISLSRSREMTSLSPLTGLPGNQRIESVLTTVVHRAEPFALLHADLDNFKAFNDHYGVVRGDAAIRALSSTILAAVERGGDPEVFVGHVGGDDFVVVMRPEGAELMAQRIVDGWDRQVADLYDPADAARGGIAMPDRRGRMRFFPLMSLSIGITTNEKRPIGSAIEAADLAAEMKELAKRDESSSWAVDRRSVDLDRLAARETLQSLASDPARTVMIVDDEPDMREILKLHCELLGWNVVAEADDGVQAFLRAAEHQPAFVILDYKMPEMRGDEAAAKIRDVAPATTIVAFSAVLDERPPWADDYLSKDQISEMTPLLGRLLEAKLPN